LVQKKPPGFAGRFFFSNSVRGYSPLPKRRDHQPALRGAASSAAEGAGSAAAGAGGAAGSDSAWLTAGAGSDGGLVMNETFSRTVERRRAAARSASCAVSSAVGALLTVSGEA
jgi:hypothetical protein